jgi:uncharacterized protein with PIN domain
MLGGLARWLRMLGQDVVYNVNLTDNSLLELAKNEKRVLLARDLELYKRAVIRCLDALYIERKTEVGRLVEVSKRYNVPLVVDMDKAHCPICNGKVVAANKAQLKNQLKANTYANHKQFWQCSNCGQIYWQGSHWKQITKTLTETQQLS